MTPERFRQCMDVTGFSTRGLADLLRRDDRRIRRWATGVREIPADVAAWLDGLARYMEAHPPPGPPADGEAD